MISLSLGLGPLVWLGLYGVVARKWILRMEVVKWKTGVDQGSNWRALVEILCSIDTGDCRSYEAVQVLVHVADGKKILLEACSSISYR
ncbi:hypothetical protein AAHA92_23727 [Salvia divinorum]|uniref:Uncharacterized protein n=1 Tax=Salvia divinorum TaxID=28513 RepID=A0ABD1GSW4_SALDI